DVPSGNFRHAFSKTEYKIAEDGKVQWRRSDFSGEKTVDYFIGSSAAGRSYLYTQDRFLFQAPVTWYAQKNRWDVSPGYERDRTPRWNRPIEAKCLYCHTSQARPIYGTQNRYADPPFLQNGIACERCHGPGSEHVRGKGSLVNPAKLSPARRDSVCSQCHLSGDARIEKLDKRLAMYRPGELLTDYVSYFVYEGSIGKNLTATSHVEKLEQSRCKVASGDRLWCGTCHDPHTVPSSEQRASWFRAKCHSCHEPDDCRRGYDCISCHMPRSRVIDGGHGVLTDHSIPRRRSQDSFDSSRLFRLVDFHGHTAAPRELGLAYAELFLRTGDSRHETEAIRLLEGNAADPAAMIRLADLYQRRGDPGRARPLYEAALRHNPHSVVALVNLGGIYGSQGNYESAIKLWQEALDRNPGLMEAGMNLAAAFKVIGRKEEAEAVLKRMKEFQPGLLPD
ncbi:MAG: tetratricopeptide repeat protein, partial [Bryobacteraceae bacterium]